FVAVASRMALGTASPLLTPTLRARVALAVDLPVGTEVNVAPLCFSLVTRLDTRHEWLVANSTGALPARRLAALLLEHAAREALFRQQLGDPQPTALLLPQLSSDVFQRLLFDREPLVWRHAAVARGIVAALSEKVRDQVNADLDVQLGVTHWRRGLVSLTASNVVEDEDSRLSVKAVLQGPLIEKDPGLASVIFLAVPRLYEADPEFAEGLVSYLVKGQFKGTQFALTEVLSSIRDSQFASESRRELRDELLQVVRKQSPLERAMASRALSLLGQDESNRSLSSLVAEALRSFELDGAKEAYQCAVTAMNEAHDEAVFIESVDPEEADSFATVAAAVTDLDAGAFESAALSHLLLLARPPGASGGVVDSMQALQTRMSHWVLRGIQAAGRTHWSREVGLADQRRLRVLLHLVDAESGATQQGGSSPVGARLQRSTRILLGRLAQGPDAGVHRLLCAALARSIDAAVREGVMRASDLVLVIADQVTDPFSVSTMAEASTLPEVSAPLAALAHFMSPELLEAGADISTVTNSFSLEPQRARVSQSQESLRRVERLMALSQGVFGGGEYQAEALRRVFFRLGRALEQIAVATGISELIISREGTPAALLELGESLEDLTEMLQGAQRRVLGEKVEARQKDAGVPDLFHLAEQAVSQDLALDGDELSRSAEQMVQGLPEPLRLAVEHVAFGLHQLPLQSRPTSLAVSLGNRKAALPAWLLPRRTIGSFYVVRPLGAGGVSSVFYARRIEEKNSNSAEAFALKVPEFDPATARSMSESEFNHMFRDEAGALLSLPQHENLARFVTFDLSARPKPILVMELIRGKPLDRLMVAKSLTLKKVITYLDGILAGLEAMHGVGVGHLDVKASNVILRGGTTPVLVDFGLSGRKIRPGCGTLEYTSPEVLGVLPEGVEADPCAADIYSFGCLAYEMLMGKLLFDGPDEMAVVSQHVAHDGWLPALEAIYSDPRCEALAKLFRDCLRRDPKERPTAAHLRHRLTSSLLPLIEQAWPFVPRADEAG
ncbi:MAG: serine/threonine protein kinase, partial [Polyangiaceae bacterium]|nr:serine/threonine protein kinase [Polyangiaceae bacterium]